VGKDVSDEIADIYGRCFEGVFCYCAYRLFKKDIAEDAVSAGFLRLVEKYPTLRDKEPIKIRNWLYGTASNVVAGYLRDDRRRREICEELRREKEKLFTQGNENNSLDWPGLYEAVGKLKRKDQDVIALRYFQGLETASVAEAMGMKHVAARVRLSRAVKKLRRELGVSFGE